MTQDAENVSPRGNYTRGVDQILSLPRAHVYRNGGLILATATDTVIVWDAKITDNDGMWNPLNPNFLTCRTAGRYAIKAWDDWAVSGLGSRLMRIRINGGAKLDGPITQGNPNQNTSVIDVDLDAGDTISVLVNQSSGGNLGFNAATAGSWVNGLQAACISLP